jgi:hypothetical protein
MQDDKKKLAIVGALVVVMLAIGAFQFATTGTQPAPPAEEKIEAKAEEQQILDEGAEGEPKVVAQVLPQRDPFQAASLPPIVADDPPVATPPAPEPVRNRPQASPVRPAQSAQIRPYNPLPGQLPLPDVGGVQMNPLGGVPAPREDVFEYRVSGLIVGRKPVAVFADAQGNQRLVPLGGSIDGDSKVVGIDRGRVTVIHKGKTLTLTPGGNPSER